MAVARRPRAFRFTGSDRAYTAWLEQCLLALQKDQTSLYYKSSQSPSHSQYHAPTAPVAQQHGAQVEVRATPLQSPATLIAFVREDPGAEPRIEKPVPAATPTRGFWADLPHNEDSWRQRRALTQTSTREELAATFTIIIGHFTLFDYPCQTRIEQIEQIEQDGIIGLLRRYGSMVGQLESSKVRMTQMFNFCTLLFVCLLIVAIELGVPVAEVNQCLKDYLEKIQGSSKLDGQYGARLRTCVIKLVKWTHKQSKGPLAHRAWEMLYQYITSIHQVRNVVEQMECAGPVAICEPPSDEIQADFPFEIPFLIKAIYGKVCSPEKINRPFGTDLREDAFQERMEKLTAQMAGVSLGEKGSKEGFEASESLVSPIPFADAEPAPGWNNLTNSEEFMNSAHLVFPQDPLLSTFLHDLLPGGDVGNLDELAFD